jgi:cob(I)alamin adenosyltransferase
MPVGIGRQPPRTAEALMGKIYTKTGDDGSTGLLGPGRLRKDDARVEAYGAVDELNAVLGAARACAFDRELDSELNQLQNELFTVGSALADPDPDGPFHNALDEAHVARLERRIDAFESELLALDQFILPGGAASAAQLHLARTVCRRAERRAVHLATCDGQHVSPVLLVYLNRLSDALFVLARVANHRAGVADVPWVGP